MEYFHFNFPSGVSGLFASLLEGKPLPSEAIAPQCWPLGDTGRLWCVCFALLSNYGSIFMSVYTLTHFLIYIGYHKTILP